MNTLAALSVLVLFVAALVRPHAAHCPAAWHADGIRRDGSYECARPFGCRDVRGPRGGWTSTCAGEQRIGGRLYCTSGQQPVVGSDGVSVGCQRGGYP